MTSGAVRAGALALLRGAAGPVLVLGRRTAAWEAALRAAGWTTARAGERAGAALVSFVGEPGDTAARRRALAEAHGRLGPGAALVLVDHNQPRRWRGRVLGAAALLVRGLGPARGRYPAAREVDGAGFRVERLALAAGERAQLVLARREG